MIIYTNRRLAPVSLAGLLLACTMFTSTGHAEDAAPARRSADEAQADMIVVTGTRDPKRLASESLSPIDVVSSQKLLNTGNGDLRDALVKVMPSLNRQAMGWVAANLTSAFTLRGLSPNYVLVLVNGKRRHPTANMTTGQGPQQGSTGADIDLIPLAAIDHVEVLRDGAAAQYGSDAIAGVVNIVLKGSSHGGSLSLLTGQTYEGDGFGANASGDVGFGFASGKGFLRLSADIQHHDHTVRSGIDTRTNARTNLSYGDPRIDRQAVSFNSGIDLGGDVQLYGFGTYAHRTGASYQNFRVSSIAPAVYPAGFSPIVRLREHDAAITLGVKGSDLAGWRWDISSTYGSDHADITTTSNINLSLFNATGNAQRRFHLGTYSNSQWTNNLDLSRSIELGLAEPLTLSLGGEYRRDGYKVGAGEANALYGAGTQALQGQSLLSAGSHARNVLASYLDLSTALAQRWRVDLAGRLEHFSDIGTTKNVKLSTRYDLSPAIALRGTVGTGFRAPSLAQEYYSSLTISPTSAIGVLSNDSSAARMLGATKLGPEKSTDFGAGLVFRPVRNLDIAIDAYQIKVKNRIVVGGAYGGATGLAALREAGFVLPAGLTSVNVSYFTNGANTRTRGLDITANYRLDLGDLGGLHLDLAANLNKTKATRIATDANGNPALNAQALGWITTESPKSKIIAGGTWSRGAFDLTLHVTRYGRTSTQNSYTSGPYAYSTSRFVYFENRPKLITDIELDYAISRAITLGIGADNLFDVRPDILPADAVYYGATRYDVYGSQIGMNGGRYYIALRSRF